jgi:hypothetical protein
MRGPRRQEQFREIPPPAIEEGPRRAPPAGKESCPACQEYLPREERRKAGLPRETREADWTFLPRGGLAYRVPLLRTGSAALIAYPGAACSKRRHSVKRCQVTRPSALLYRRSVSIQPTTQNDRAARVLRAHRRTLTRRAVAVEQVVHWAAAAAAAQTAGSCCVFGRFILVD